MGAVSGSLHFSVEELDVIKADVWHILKSIDLSENHKIIRQNILEKIENSNTIAKVIDYEYEMFFKSTLSDFVKIDGWYPIATDRIVRPEKIDNYIETGLLRRVTHIEKIK